MGDVMDWWWLGGGDSSFWKTYRTQETTSRRKTVTAPKRTKIRMISLNRIRKECKYVRFHSFWFSVTSQILYFPLRSSALAGKDTDNEFKSHEKRKCVNMLNFAIFYSLYYNLSYSLFFFEIKCACVLIKGLNRPRKESRCEYCLQWLNYLFPIFSFVDKSPCLIRYCRQA